MGVGAGLCMYDVVVKKFTFAISSPDEFLAVLRPMVTNDDNDTTAIKLSGPIQQISYE